MARSPFEKVSVIKDDAAAERFIEACKHPAPPPTAEQKEKLRRMMERGEELVKVLSSRLEP